MLVVYETFKIAITKFELVRNEIVHVVHRLCSEFYNLLWFTCNSHRGLLSAHVLANTLKYEVPALQWYNGELLAMAEDLGRRLLPSFNTSTGIPHGKVSVLNIFIRTQKWYDFHGMYLVIFIIIVKSVTMT